MSEPQRYTGKTELWSILGSPHWEHPEGEWVKWEDYASLKAEVEKWQKNTQLMGRQLNDELEQVARLKAEVERLKAVSTIEQRTIQGLQQTPEWSEIARLTAYCRELEGKVSHIDLFKSVVEKFFNSADLKNHPDAQSCYALAENLKQLPDSILDFTEEQVRDNPAWALAVFRHKVKEMQYKRCHDLNEIGGEQEENARLKAQVERLTTIIGADAIDREHGMCCDASAQVERLTQLNSTLALRYDATNSMLDGCAKEIEEMEAEVERLTKAVMHSPAAQLKLKELEGKTTYEEINPKEGNKSK